MIAFVVNVYHDQPLALRLALQIRHFYPAAPLLIVGDGVTISRELGQQGTPVEMLREESDYQKMLEAQNRSCAICGRQLPLCVDHNHLTGKVRALLCGRCNRMLGQGGESASLLRAGAKYLEEHSCV